VLKACRSLHPGVSAGEAVAAWLSSLHGSIRTVVDHGIREGTWLSVGPIRPGIRVGDTPDFFRVGNAAGESHPLIGEGINMALQSAFLLANQVGARRAVGALEVRRIARQYAAAWRDSFSPRLRFAQAYAHAAMRPALSVPVHALLRHWPGLLTKAARWAGKARGRDASSRVGQTP
jgi:flavin-dependent dehydrogenase